MVRFVTVELKIKIVESSRIYSNIYKGRIISFDRSIRSVNRMRDEGWWSNGSWSCPYSEQGHSQLELFGVKSLCRLNMVEIVGKKFASWKTTAAWGQSIRRQKGHCLNPDTLYCMCCLSCAARWSIEIFSLKVGSQNFKLELRKVMVLFLVF